MSEPTKWWLICDGDVKEIRAGLMAPTHERNDFNCQDWPPGEGCKGCIGDAERSAGLHCLESGLNSTDQIPSDFQDKGPKVDEKFVKKWSEILYNTVMGEFKKTIVTTLLEAGVRVKEGIDER